jgi:proteasome assembly chaperone (PAC2) family protein
VVPHDPLRFHVRPALRDPSLVLALEGWNDAGESATAAARYLAAQLRAVPLAEIDAEEFYDFTVRRPQVVVEEGIARRLEWPSTRFLFGTARPARGDDERELVVGIGIEPHLRWHAWSDQVLRVVAELGARRVVLLGAYLAEVLYSRPVDVTGVASSSELVHALDVGPVRYSGPTGMLGVLGQRLRESGCEVVALWAGLPHYIELAPNARGALALLERAVRFLDVALDLAPLERAAQECEQRISAMVSGDPELSEYVRELERREFGAGGG